MGQGYCWLPRREDFSVFFCRNKLLQCQMFNAMWLVEEALCCCPLMVCMVFASSRQDFRGHLEITSLTWSDFFKWSWSLPQSDVAAAVTTSAVCPPLLLSYVTIVLYPRDEQVISVYIVYCGHWPCWLLLSGQYEFISKVLLGATIAARHLLSHCFSTSVNAIIIDRWKKLSA